jgi:hypothetical protein
MTTTKKLPASIATGKLDRVVLRWINKEARERTDGVEGVLKDLFHGGCASGYVGPMIYTADCVAFYRKHQREVDAMLAETIRDTGSDPSELFRDWDKADPLAREDGNQNILAWFAWEETARKLGHLADIDA